MATSEQDQDDFSPQQIVWSIVALLAIVFGIAWAVQGNNFFLYKFFAPREEAVRRETFEQSKAYVQGTIQELYKQQVEYAKATPEQKVALSSVIRHQAAGFDEKLLPDDLKQFIDQLKREALGAK